MMGTSSSVESRDTVAGEESHSCLFCSKSPPGAGQRAAGTQDKEKTENVFKKIKEEKKSKKEDEKVDDWKCYNKPEPWNKPWNE